MRFEEIYRTAIKLGIDSDPRPSSELGLAFKRAKEELKKKDCLLDADSAWNPYPDSRVLYGGGRQVRKVMVGIDIDTGELLLADRFRSQGVQGVIAHHPQGRGLLGLSGAMEVQKDWLANFGVQPNAAEDVLSGRISEVERSVLPSNHMKTADAARLLDLPLMCIHSAADIIGQTRMQKLVDNADPRKVKDVVEVIAGQEEYRMARKYGLAPKVIAGGESDRCGRVAVKFAGGTSFGKETYKELADAGVGTVVCMHAPENHLEEARKHHVRIVISGHMPSDSFGLNFLCDELERRGVDTLPCSGFLRFRRGKGKGAKK